MAALLLCSRRSLRTEMKSWGRYQLVLTPADADLVFEIRFAAPIGMVSVMNGIGSSTVDPQLRLVILDPKTRIALWGFTEHVQPIGMREARERNQKQVIITINRNFDQAMINLVADIKTVAGQPVVSANRAKP